MSEPIRTDSPEWWDAIAYACRCGHQPLSCLLPVDKLPLSAEDLGEFNQAVSRIVGLENDMDPNQCTSGESVSQIVITHSP